MSNTVLNASFVNISSVEHKEGPQFSLGYPCGSAGKEYSCNVGDLGLIPGLGGCPGGEHGNPLSILAWRIPMDRGPWWATVHGVTKNWTRLSD